MTQHPKNLTTAERAIKAAKEAEKQGFVVRGFRVNGRDYEVLLGSAEAGSEYDLVNYET